MRRRPQTTVFRSAGLVLISNDYGGTWSAVSPVTGELYGVRVIERMVRARSAGRAIVEEAARRNAEIIVLGAPRLPHRTRKSAIFGKTVDYVLRHAPCRVMVAAAARRAS